MSKPVYVLNTETGVIFHKTRLMDMRAHLCIYEPTDEELRIGKKIAKVPEIVPHQPEEPAEIVEPPETKGDEEEINLAPEVGVDGGDPDAAAAETAPVVVKETAPKKKATAKRKSAKRKKK